MDDVSFEKLVEIGDKNLDRKEYDFAIKYYTRALKYIEDNIPPEKIEYSFVEKIPLYTKLINAYELKGNLVKDGKTMYYRSALDFCRKSILITPYDRNLNNRYIVLARKSGVIDEVAIEYKEKLDREPENKLYKECLKKIYTVSTFNITDSVSYGYRPGLIVRLIFDFMLLPLSIFLIGMSIFSKAFRSMLHQAIMLFLFYCLYRLVLIRSKSSRTKSTIY